MGKNQPLGSLFVEKSWETYIWVIDILGCCGLYWLFLVTVNQLTGLGMPVTIAQCGCQNRPGLHCNICKQALNTVFLSWKQKSSESKTNTTEKWKGMKNRNNAMGHESQQTSSEPEDIKVHSIRNLSAGPPFRQASEGKASRTPSETCAKKFQHCYAVPTDATECSYAVRAMSWMR